MDIPFLSMTLPELIQSIGYLGVFVIVFIESGIPIGLVLPLPGDTLLFSAGFLAATSVFDLVPLLAVIIVGAILGDSAGYWFGAKFGTRLFEKEKALFLNKRNLERTRRFYEKHGGKAIILARFLPLFRTLVPLFAGVVRMPYHSFLIYNVSGAFFWGISVTLLGYYLGSVIPNIDHYIMPVLLVVILISTLSVVWEYFKARKELKENTAP
ncbi:MAG TPA: DedA family protein [Candidatus Paceibacterota bacterium]|nr:DedA family protein [Candidatus Paceibacterota bacterium]